MGIETGANKFHVDLVRHTKSDYKNYLELEQRGADPNTYIEANDQVPDITHEGRALAERKAAEYAAQIDPTTEMVVIVSSLEMRAYQTAKIYAHALEKRGVEIIPGIPSQHEEIGGTYPVGIKSDVQEDDATLDKRIIPHSAPSLAYPSIWVQDMLEPTITSGKTTFSGLDESQLSDEDKERFQVARSIIEEEGDKESGWGANYVKYQGQAYPFDIIPTAKENLERIMQGIQLLRTLHRSQKTQQMEHEKGKKIRYLVITHEENMLEMARGYFGVSHIDNCDLIGLTVPSEKGKFIEGKFHEKEVKMSYLRLRDEHMQRIAKERSQILLNSEKNETINHALDTLSEKEDIRKFFSDYAQWVREQLPDEKLPQLVAWWSLFAVIRKREDAEKSLENRWKKALSPNAGPE